MSETRNDAEIWFCPKWGCPVTGRETEQVVLHLEGHCESDEVIHRELEDFREAVENGDIACNKALDDPQHPRNRE